MPSNDSDLRNRLADFRKRLGAVTELAVYFQEDYTRKLPVIAAFRQWRSGSISTEQFLNRLREDDLAEVLRIEPVAPMEGLAIVNDYRLKVHIEVGQFVEWESPNTGNTHKGRVQERQEIDDDVLLRIKVAGDPGDAIMAEADCRVLPKKEKP